MIFSPQTENDPFLILYVRTFKIFYSVSLGLIAHNIHPSTREAQTECPNALTERKKVLKLKL